jgi:hypothetical protein
MGEADVTVADLGKREICIALRCDLLAQRARREYSAKGGPGQPRADPGHAFEEATAVDAVALLLRENSLSHLCLLLFNRLEMIT